MGFIWGNTIRGFGVWEDRKGVGKDLGKYGLGVVWCRERGLEGDFGEILRGYFSSQSQKRLPMGYGEKRGFFCRF